MKKDLRFIKTEESLYDTMLELLKTNTIDKITVTMICHEAKCSRNAFYLHYQTKEDLYNSIINDCIASIQKACEPVVNKFKEIQERQNYLFMSHIINAVENSKNTIYILIKSSHGVFSDMLKEAIYQSFRKTSVELSKQAVTDAYCSYNMFLASGIVGFLEYWLTESHMSIDEAKNTLTKLTSGSTKEMIKDFS
ncbi:TetR/AcrR family transcriptional regulator [Clostridium sp. 19966]|uniref:TetR/AcrR family transcriptional regulator n=1 Tax=Clostridium sp. 19966 TaxID=2768166 RepID=UPI0028E0050C|nr:TetR/AcrR family transcriptional regulator [Clostridium sp. 19966]MDT8719454.1 TetR/AcrR family transcriptional regulator [Clostridium sp. 19966]